MTRHATTCWHFTDECYELMSGPVWVRYCRHDDCQAWRIAVRHPSGNGTSVGMHGQGLEDYRDAIARGVFHVLPEWKDAEFFLNLGGHAEELGPFEGES